MPNSPVAPENLRGMNLINSPIWNKGTSFTLEERDAFALEGLLPPYVESLEEQVARAYLSMQPSSSNIEKHMYLRGLQDTNEVLFYRLLLEHPEELIPLIYKPTVAEGCRKFDEIYRRPRGIFISYPLRNRISELLQNRPYLEVDLAVVTDGEQISGYGDAGANGLAISIAKLSLYSLLGGIHPSRTLPIVLDVGTNNPALLSNPAYTGWRHERIEEAEYLDFLDQFVHATKKEMPGTCIQWEGLASSKAEIICQRYGLSFPSLNEMTEGSASFTVAMLEAAFRARETLLRNGKFIFYGATPESLKAVSYLRQRLQADSLSSAQARRQIWVVDQQGLLHDQRRDLSPEQLSCAQFLAETSGWMKNGHLGLETVVRNVEASALLQFSEWSGTLHEHVLRMFNAKKSPILFLFLPDQNRFDVKGRELGNMGEFKIDPVYAGDLYILPGIGLGLAACHASRVTDDMMLAAARTLALHSPALEQPTKPLLPEFAELRHVAREIAVAVGREAQRAGIAPRTSEDELRQQVQDAQWLPAYPPVISAVMRN